MFRVGALYLVVGAVLVEVAVDVFPVLQLPPWSSTLVVALLIVGFPVALILAWAFETTPEGIRYHPPTDLGPTGVSGEDSPPVARSATQEPVAPDVAPVGSTERDPERATGEAAGGAPSIAVLPFVNMSRAVENDFFSDGMTEELINALTQVDALRVAARTSAFAFKGRNEDIRTIGGALSVSHVVEGSVRRSEERLRITVQLIDVATGYHLWSENYDRELEDVFVIQEEIAQAIVSTLRIRLRTRAPLVRSGTRNERAYREFLKGRFCWNRRTESGLKQSVQEFQRAIEEDPAYAQAYAGLADAYAVLGIAEYGMLPPEDVMPRAKSAALKALELDPGLAEAQTTLAHVEAFYDWDWEKAERSFLRAMELDENYAFSHHWYACFLAALGRSEEALAAELRARELEPLAVIINKNVGTILYYGRRLDEAIAEYEKALELDAEYARTHLYLGLAYVAAGELDAAVGELRRAAGVDPTNTVIEAALGMAYGLAGETAEARGVLEDLDRQRESAFVPALNLAMVHVGLGEHGKALDFLEEAYGERSSWMISLAVEPIFDPLREEPRYRRLVEKVGIP